MSVSPECCIAGVDGQTWPCRWAWLVAFQTGSVRALLVADAAARGPHEVSAAATASRLEPRRSVSG